MNDTAVEMTTDAALLPLILVLGDIAQRIEQEQSSADGQYDQPNDA